MNNKPTSPATQPPNIFKNDYNLNSLVKIKTKSGIPMYITPRYRSHYQKNDYEPFSAKTIQNIVSNNSTFLDIGAHYGYFCLVSSLKRKNIKIIAVEAIPQNCQVLEMNLKLNSITDYTIHTLAVSDKIETKKFIMTNASDSSSFYSHPLAKSIKKISIKTNTIDNIIKKLKIDFIKIDVEGHEIPVLKGAQKTLKNNPDCPILIEYNPPCQILAGHKPEDLLNLLLQKKFDIFFVAESSQKLYLLDISPNNWPQIIQIDQSYKNHNYFNLLCIPKNKYKKYPFIKKHLAYISKKLAQLPNNNNPSHYDNLLVYKQQFQKKETQLHLKFKHQYDLITKELNKTRQETKKIQEEFGKIQKELNKTQSEFGKSQKELIKLHNKLRQSHQKYQQLNSQFQNKLRLKINKLLPKK